MPEGSNLTLDLNGYKLTMHGPGAGSQGTQTLAFQFLKDSTITIKNGKIVAQYPLKMGIQNYSNLTLDNVEVYGDEAITYTLSNNYGNIVLKNHTSLNPTANNVAFDVYYGMNVAYDSGVHVTIADPTVQVNGKVEYSKARRASESDFEANASLTIPSSMELDMSLVPAGFGWADNGDGTKTFKKL